MSIGTAIQSAVSGFADGRNVRHSWEDRKTQNKRNERLDEILEAREVRAQEAHAMDLETGGLLNSQRRQSIRQTDLAWDDLNRYRSAFDADEANGVMSPAQGELPPARVSTSGQPDRLTEDGIARAQRAATAPVLGAIPNGTSAPAQAAVPRYEPVTPRRVDVLGAVPDGAWDRFNGADPGGTMEQAAAGGVASSVADLGAVPRHQPQQPAQDANGQTIVGGVILPPALGPDGKTTAPTRSADPNADLDRAYSWGENGNMLSDIDRVGRIGKRGVEDAISRTGEAIVNQGIGSIQRLNSPFQAASRYATGKDHIGAPARVDLNGDGARESLATPVSTALGAIRADTSQRPRKPEPDNAPTAAGNASTPEGKAASEGAVRAIDAVAERSPDMANALSKATGPALGASAKAPMTKAQQERYGERIAKGYSETRGSNAVRELLRQGRFDDAEKFQEFIKSKQTQAGLRAYGSAMVAFSAGDIEAGLEHAANAYNAPGYFDDGYELVKEESEALRDETGSIVGLKLAMRNRATGEVFVSSGNMDQMAERILQNLDPERAFEASMARLQARQESLLKSQEEQRGVANDLIKSSFTETLRLARDIFSKSQSAAKDARDAAMPGDDPSAIPEVITWDEAMAEAQRLMTEGPRQPAQDASGEVAVARRPQ